MTVNIKSAVLSGEVNIPSSKSEAHRYLICAAFADKPTELTVNGICSDIEATAECLTALGAGIERTAYGYRIIPFKDAESGPMLHCRDSGSTLRFLLPVAAVLGCDASFLMEGRLPSRPLAPLDGVMLEHGTEITLDSSRLKLSGKMSGNYYKIAANVSSQFISGILMALPLIGGGTVELTDKVESASYIKLTVKVMREFGVTVEIDGCRISTHGTYTSPGKTVAYGDWSGAAFFACAGALSKEGVTCRGVSLGSIQGDKAILDVLRKMGAEVVTSQDSFSVKHKDLIGCTVDAADIPDLVPVISTVAAVARGETRIVNASRLRLKESDRLAVMSEVLTSLGADVKETEDGLIISGKPRLSGGTVSSHRDHRVAMSAAVASIACEGDVTVRGAECVTKSYPTFWHHFSSVGALLEVSED